MNRRISKCQNRIFVHRFTQVFCPLKLTKGKGVRPPKSLFLIMINNSRG